MSDEYVPEIEVTSAMISAGLEVLLEVPLTQPSLPQLRQAVEEVFRAMMQAQPSVSL